MAWSRRKGLPPGRLWLLRGATGGRGGFVCLYVDVYLHLSSDCSLTYGPYHIPFECLYGIIFRFAFIVNLEYFLFALTQYCNLFYVQKGPRREFSL